MLLFGGLLWFSFLKLPASVSPEQVPSWESVLSFIASHHLQWGRDVVFNYGPLGFLTIDCYWGDHFWTILLYAFGFSLFLTISVSRLLGRLPSLLRVVLCVLVPWITVPHWQDLSFDPVYLFAITLTGISALQDKRLLVWLTIYGAALGCFSLIKFTFCIYAIFTFLLVVLNFWWCHERKALGVFFISGMAAFLVAWVLAGQGLGNIGNWFFYAWQIASQYPTAMAIVPARNELLFGVVIALAAFVLLVTQDAKTAKYKGQIACSLLLLAGLFLAWKEAYVRADVHIVVFQVYVFLVVAMLPAWMPLTGRMRDWITWASLLVMVIALLPLNQRSAEFMVTAKNGLGTKILDAATAVFAPLKYKQFLEQELEEKRQSAKLPQISALLGNLPVGVLNYDQDVAILNNFNFQPHPVFQSYAAHSPQLERLNYDFFNSAAAPEFVLWRYCTIDGRFPSLDDGAVMLKILADYSPVMTEKNFVLWKRNLHSGQKYSIIEPLEVAIPSGSWTGVPSVPVWTRIELRETWFGLATKILLRGDMPEIEVRLADGTTASYRLPPANAEYGFVLNPLLTPDSNLGFPLLGTKKPAQITAIRVQADHNCFDGQVRIKFSKIQGVTALEKR